MLYYQNKGRETMPELVFDDNTLVNKLQILFIFDKMGIPLTESTLLEICATRNNWISYMELIDSINTLETSGFLYRSTSSAKVEYYTITTSGHECLNSFFARIPNSRRNEIVKYVKENRMVFKRAQEYAHSYSQNDDGTYTVVLKIVDPTHSIMEMKLNVANRKTAKSVAGKWEKNAAEVYSSVFEKLVD